MTKKISALPAASAPDGTELFEVVQGGVSKKATVSQGFAPASRYEAGGDDPITNLGYVAFKTGTDIAVEIIDDPDSAGNPRLRILNPATGDPYVNIGLTTNGWPGITILDSGATVAQISEQQIVLGDPQGVNWFFVDTSGTAVFSDGVSTRFQVLPSEGLVRLIDASPETRVEIKDDGTGVTLYDATGDPSSRLSETALTLTDGVTDRIVLTPGDGTGAAFTNTDGSFTALLNETALAFVDSNNPLLPATTGLGPAYGGLLLPSGQTVTINDADQTIRVLIAPDGTGVTFSDAAAASDASYATALVLGAEGNNNHGAVIRGWDNAGKLRAQMDLGMISGDTFEVKINDAAEVLRNDISCYDTAMEFNHQQDDAVLRSQVTVGASGPGVTEDAVFLGTYDAAALEKGRIKLDNSVLTMGIGSTGITVDAAEINFLASGIGLFGASAYGQDAYLAPLDDNLSALTTLVDLITAENETRTRINAINGYIIARGWEAAA